METIPDDSSSSSGDSSQAELPAGSPGRAHADPVCIASDSDDYDDWDVPEMIPLHGHDVVEGGAPELEER